MKTYLSQLKQIGAFENVNERNHTYECAVPCAISVTKMSLYSYHKMKTNEEHKQYRRTKP